MSKTTSQAFSSYRRNRTVLSFRERYRLTVFVSNGTVAVMAQRGVSLKSVLTCYEKNKMIFFFIWAVIDFLTINISWFLLNIKQHPSPISRKPQTVLNVWMAWIVCIVLFSDHKCACPMSRAIAATFWPRGRRALRARRPRGPNVKNTKMIRVWWTLFLLMFWPRLFYSKSSWCMNEGSKRKMPAWSLVLKVGFFSAMSSTAMQCWYLLFQNKLTKMFGYT